MAPKSNNNADTESKLPYPGASSLLYPIYRMILTSTVAVLIMHFIINPFVAPLIFNVTNSEMVQNFLTNNFLMKWIQSTSFISNRLRDQQQTFTDVATYSIGSTIVHLGVYVPLTSFFALCDRKNGWFLKQYKIPRLPSQVPTWDMMKRTIFEQVKTSLVFGYFSLGLFFILFCKGWKNLKNDKSNLTTWQNSTPFHIQVLYFIGADLCNGFGFHLIHSLVHHPLLYSRIHKFHHQYVGSVAIAAEHATEVEQLFANFFPTVIWMALNSGNVPISAHFAWLAVRMIETLEAHSGYDLRYTFLHQIGILHGTTFHHDMHHTLGGKPNGGNFGAYHTDWFTGSLLEFTPAGKLAPRAPAQCE